MRVPSTALRETLDMISTQTDTVMLRPGTVGENTVWRFVSYRTDRTALIDITLVVIDDGQTVPTVTFKVSEWQRAIRSLTGDVTVTYIDGRTVLSDTQYRFTIPVDGGEPTEVRVPQIQTTVDVMCEIKDLRGLMVADPKRSDGMSLTVTANGMVMTSEDERGGVSYTVPQERCAILALPPEGRVVTSYPLETFNEFMRAAPVDMGVGVRFARDLPLIVEFGGRGYDGMWLLAPRIEEE